jgi:hypothetical protein
MQILISGCVCYSNTQLAKLTLQWIFPRLMEMLNETNPFTDTIISFERLWAVYIAQIDIHWLFCQKWKLKPFAHCFSSLLCELSRHCLYCSVSKKAIKRLIYPTGSSKSDLLQKFIVASDLIAHCRRENRASFKRFEMDCRMLIIDWNGFCLSIENMHISIDICTCILLPFSHSSFMGTEHLIDWQWRIQVTVRQSKKK